MPLSVIEGARTSKDLNCKKVDIEVAFNISLAFLRAQCIDLEKLDSSNLNNWVLDPNRVEYIISQYPFKCDNLNELANEFVKTFVVEKAFVFWNKPRNSK